MASGGLFRRGLMNKELAGSYWNFQTLNPVEPNMSDTGHMAFPIQLPFAISGELMPIEASQWFGDGSSELYIGYNAFSEGVPTDLQLAMWNGVKTLWLYDPSTGKLPATATNGTGTDETTLTLARAGSAGNEVAYAALDNEDGTFNIRVYFKGNSLAFMEADNVSDWSQIPDDIREVNFVIFPDKGVIFEQAIINFSGGDDGIMPTDTTWHASFLNLLYANKQINTTVYMGQEPAMQMNYKQFAISSREEEGNRIVVAIPKYEADYIGVISNANTVKFRGKAYTLEQGALILAAQYCTRMPADIGLGALAVEGADAVTGNYRSTQIIENKRKGLMSFIVQRSGKIAVEEGINTFTSFTPIANRAMRSIETIVTIDALRFDMSEYFDRYIKDIVSNSLEGHIYIKRIYMRYLQILVNLGAIEAVENDEVQVRAGVELKDAILDLEMQIIAKINKLYNNVDLRN